MIFEQLVDELKQEAAKTRQLIERLPEEKLTWTPHPKSMTLGQLAWHVAVLPRGIADLVTELNVGPPVVPRPQPASVAEILAALEQSALYAEQKISGWADDGLRKTWRLTLKGETLFEMPRGAVLRTLMLNHTYHHRGQLTVYLRLLDVPVPGMFGPTADENPFG
jgi:uncharacterized damage-inducible protein DinB